MLERPNGLRFSRDEPPGRTAQAADMVMRFVVGCKRGLGCAKRQAIRRYPR
jgi:hypothetical protein